MAKFRLLACHSSRHYLTATDTEPYDHQEEAILELFAGNNIIMDEFHYYSDHSRGAAWQIPLLTLPRARFLLMSATLGDSSSFSKQLTALTGAPTTLVQSDQRPVPLEFEYSTTQLQEKSPNSTNKAARPSISSISPRTPAPTPPATCSPPTSAPRRKNTPSPAPSTTPISARPTAANSPKSSATVCLEERI